MDNETLEIERGGWAAFAEDFSKQHGGETATLESIGADDGDQYPAENLPFVGMTLESKGSAVGSLIVMLGTEGAEHIERLIAAPKSLRVHVSPGGETTLEIEADDEPTLLLHLQTPKELPAP
jgi:hypothetical protein